MKKRVVEKVTSSQKPTVAKLIVKCLENEGVKYVFGIPGEENIHLIDALNNSSIRFILVHHEQLPRSWRTCMAVLQGRLAYVLGR